MTKNQGVMYLSRQGNAALLNMNAGKENLIFPTDADAAASLGKKNHRRYALLMLINARMEQLLAAAALTAVLSHALQHLLIYPIITDALHTRLLIARMEFCKRKQMKEDARIFIVKQTQQKCVHLAQALIHPHLLPAVQ